MNGNNKSIGEIYNLNERYVYVEDKEQGIKARISRNFLNNITNEDFLNNFNNLPLINFEYRENKKTENGIYIGFINSPGLQNEWEIIYKQGEIYQFNLFYIDNEQFKIEFNEYVFTQQFPDYYSSLKIYLYSCFNKEIKTVELRYVKWNNKLDSPIFEYPYITNETISCNEVKGKLIFVREQRIKKNARLGDVFYFKDLNNYIHRVDEWGFYDYSNYFNINDEVDLIINKFNIFEKIINSKFKNVFEKKFKTKKYKTGDELIAKVLNPQPNGAMCITEDDEMFFLSKQKITKGNVIDILSVLSPSDEILVTYQSESSNLQNEFRDFNFVKLENRIFENKNLKDVIDLKVLYTKGVAGGYSRNSDFRELVLDFYNHKCALCDDVLVYGKYSCGEAAHIVPRSSRGVNKIENALCLCKEHHWSFDRGFWTISENGEITLSSTLLKDQNFKDRYEKFNGKKIDELLKNKINPDAIEWHRRNIFKD